MFIVFYEHHKFMSVEYLIQRFDCVDKINLTFVLARKKLKPHNEQRAKMSKEQKEELKRRTLTLLYYLIRSPFYDLYSSSMINLILTLIEQRIIGTKFLIKYIKEYIPYWQSIYNYCWTV
ncbi:peroxisomal membrane PEX16 [Brachionus plicatilis]|uniref:Peroxisomal membrane protein PEX16 n=1 Tax=Brachionus plicatilis TaxID=10195 RepID=A0A3M7PKV9_BRAPC|nr:peroxisomal membrane PEX16 [Brachionus plicatilis]